MHGFSQFGPQVEQELQEPLRRLDLGWNVAHLSRVTRPAPMLSAERLHGFKYSGRCPESI